MTNITNSNKTNNNQKLNNSNNIWDDYAKLTQGVTRDPWRRNMTREGQGPFVEVRQTSRNAATLLNPSPCKPPQGRSHYISLHHASQPKIGPAATSSSSHRLWVLAVGQRVNGTRKCRWWSFSSWPVSTPADHVGHRGRRSGLLPIKERTPPVNSVRFILSKCAFTLYINQYT